MNPSSYQPPIESRKPVDDDRPKVHVFRLPLPRAGGVLAAVGACLLIAVTASISVLAFGVIRTGGLDDEEPVTTSGLSVDDVYGRVEGALTRPAQVFHTVLTSTDDPQGLLSEEIWLDAGGRTERWITRGDDVRIIWSDKIFGPGGESENRPECLGIVGYLAPAATVGFCAAEHSPKGSPRVEQGVFGGRESIVIVGNPELESGDNGIHGVLKFHLDADSYLPLGYEFTLTSDAEPADAESGSFEYTNDFVPRESLPRDFFDPSTLKDNEQ